MGKTIRRSKQYFDDDYYEDVGFQSGKTRNKKAEMAQRRRERQKRMIVDDEEDFADE